MIPEVNRNKCIFSESCSNNVYRVTEQQGLIAGLKAFNFRFANCRSGFKIFKDPNGQLFIKLVTGKTIRECEISQYIIDSSK